MDSIQTYQQKGTYIFSYGSNHPEQLSRRIQTPLKSLLERAVSCTLPGWKRVYVGQSRHWGMKSVANVIEDSDCVGEGCQGYAIKMTQEEIEKLDPFEGFPTWYLRVDVKIKIQSPNKELDGQLVDAQVYKMIKEEMLTQYYTPADEYIQACCKTLSTALYLRMGPYEEEKEKIILHIINQTSQELDKVHETYGDWTFLQQ